MSNKRALQKRNNESNVRGVLVQEHFSGPLPHPNVLVQFDVAIPGSAERILKMAEAQSAHRRELERKVVESDISRSKWGQILGFIIAVLGLIVAGAIAIFGNAVAGSIIGVGTLASLVGVFMYGSKTRSKERMENENVTEKE